jgi:anti-sigma factor (TIGR02949 family)
MSDEMRDIDCQEVLDRLYEYLDGELTPIRAQEVRRHLDLCGPCLRVSEFESAYLRFLQARARARQAPEDLRRRILERMLFDTGDADAT